MQQIKLFFSNTGIDDLEKKVNSFLKSISQRNVLEVSLVENMEKDKARLTCLVRYLAPGEFNNDRKKK
jgi:hypothetical protein